MAGVNKGSAGDVPPHLLGAYRHVWLALPQQAIKISCELVLLCASAIRLTMHMPGSGKLGKGKSHSYGLKNSRNSSSARRLANGRLFCSAFTTSCVSFGGTDARPDSPVTIHGVTRTLVHAEASRGSRLGVSYARYALLLAARPNVDACCRRVADPSPQGAPSKQPLGIGRLRRLSHQHQAR